jgi:hypothetical protein
MQACRTQPRYAQPIAFPALLAVLLAACSSSNGSPATQDAAADARPKDAAHATDVSQAKDAGVDAAVYAIVCSPRIDASHATPPPTPSTDLACPGAMFPMPLNLIDSAAALAALFPSVDGGPLCPGVPSGVDFSTQRVVIYRGTTDGNYPLTAYSVGSEFVVQVHTASCGEPIGMATVAWVVPLAEAATAQLVDCAIPATPGENGCP